MKTIGQYILLFLLLLTCRQTVQGQQLSSEQGELKGISSINQTTAKAIVGFLASDELEGREAGWKGGKIAGNYIASLLAQMGIKPVFEDYFQPFEAYRVERQKKGRLEIHPDSIEKFKQGVHQKYEMRNILAQIEGENPDEIVIVGAHYDHIGYDPMLENDQIYNGADDNASGVSAVLQIARAFKESGIRPKRTVIFAFWDGEEKGLLGSRYFTQTFVSINKVKGYLNFDMIGRNHDETNPQQVVFFYTAGKPAFEKWLKESIRNYALKLKPDYRAWENPVGGSDNTSFARLNIPIMWFHTDGHPDYHMPDDETDKINWEKLTHITEASFLCLWKMANESF